MSDFTYAPAKDPNSVEPYFFVWADKTGTNISGDDGELQGATIASYTVTPQTGLTVTTDNKNAVTIAGISYGASTVVSVWVSGGTDGQDYELLCRVVTNETPARTLDKTMIIPCRQQ